MKIQYFGHCAFHITLRDGTTLLFDPFRNELPNSNWFLYPFPSLSPDFVIITHPHFDHDEITTLANTPTIIRDPLPQIVGPNFKITSLLDSHAKGYGAAYGGWNIIFMLEAEGIRLCHWGDNQPNLTSEQFAALGRVDVLLLPVEDGAHILELDEVTQVVNTLQPKIVFPTHYFVEGITNPKSGLTDISQWLQGQPQVKIISTPSIELLPEQLPSSTEAWVFEKVANA